MVGVSKRSCRRAQTGNEKRRGRESAVLSARSARVSSVSSFPSLRSPGSTEGVAVGLTSARCPHSKHTLSPDASLTRETAQPANLVRSRARRVLLLITSPLVLDCASHFLALPYAGTGVLEMLGHANDMECWSAQTHNKSSLPASCRCAAAGALHCTLPCPGNGCPILLLLPSSWLHAAQLETSVTSLYHASMSLYTAIKQQ